MKQTLTKIILAALGLGLLAYVARLMMQSGLVVTANPVWNIGGFALAAAAGIYIIVMLAQPQLAPKSKWTLSIFGILLLVVAQMIYVDNASAHIYLKDIVKLFGVLYIIGGATGLFHDEKVIEERKMAEAEIIEC